MSDFATFTLCGTVLTEPVVICGPTQEYDAVRFAVQVRKPARDGGQPLAEEVEVAAWNNVRAQAEGLKPGCGVLVHGNLSSRKSDRGYINYSLRASAIRSLGYAGERQAPPAARPAQPNSYTPPARGQVAPTCEDEDVPF